MIPMSKLLFTCVVEWPQNGNVWYGLSESPPEFGITEKGKFKRKIRTSQNLGTDFLLAGQEKGKSVEILYEL